MHIKSIPLPFDASTEARFWAMVRESDGPDDCWPWIGPLGRSGYGAFYIKGKPYPAHRIMLALHGVVLTPDQLACHHCDTRPCVRFEHLYAGDHESNTRDMVERGRQATGDAHGSRVHPEAMRRGERHPQVKLTAEQVIEIRARWAAGTATQRELATEFGVHQDHIGGIVRRVTWRHLEPSPLVVARDSGSWKRQCPLCRRNFLGRDGGCSRCGCCAAPRAGEGGGA